jgi:hypothetical protein
MQDGTPTIVHWKYPVFIIGFTDGPLNAVQFEGRSCCLVYKNRELAELYLTQAAELGETEYAIQTLETPDALKRAVRSLKQGGVTHAIWDATVKPAAVRAADLDELLAHADDPAALGDEEPFAN